MKGIYLVGGYPDREQFIKSFKAVAESGADFIEVGIPFNDPVADGPVIASAITEAADSGISADMVLDDIETCRVKEIPVYLMTYSNILYSYGVKKFSDRCKDFIRGIILADLPNRMHRYFYERGLAVPIVPFATLESRAGDFRGLDECRSDFVYFIGLRGITGSAADFGSAEMADKLKLLKKESGKKIVIGFGVKTGDDARKAAAAGDGFVIGTEAVKRQHDTGELKKYLGQVLM